MKATSPGVTELAPRPASVPALKVADLRAFVTMVAVAGVVAAGASRAIPTLAGHDATSWVFLALAGAGIGMRLRVEGRQVRGISPVELGAAAILLGGIGAVATNSGAGLAGLLRMASHATILVAVASLPARVRSLRIVLAGLVLGVAVQVTIALVELLRGGTFLYSLWKPAIAANWAGFHRVASTPADPNYLALGLVSTLPLILAVRELWPRLGRWVVVALAGAWLLAIAFTFSRAGYVGLALLPVIMLAILPGSASGLWRLRQQLRRFWPIPGVWISIGIGLVLVLGVLWPAGPIAAFASRVGSLSVPTTDASLNVRAAAQLAAAVVFIQHPLFGIGFDQFVTAGAAPFNAISGLNYREINVLDSFLLVAAEGGIVALAGFVIATVASFRSFLENARRIRLRDDIPPPNGRMLYALGAGIVVWSLISLTLDGVHSPIQWVFFGLAGLLWRIGRVRGAQS